MENKLEKKYLAQFYKAFFNETSEYQPTVDTIAIFNQYEIMRLYAEADDQYNLAKITEASIDTKKIKEIVDYNSKQAYKETYQTNLDPSSSKYQRYFNTFKTIPERSAKQIAVHEYPEFRQAVDEFYEKLSAPKLAKEITFALSHQGTGKYTGFGNLGHAAIDNYVLKKEFEIAIKNSQPYILIKAINNEIFIHEYYEIFELFQASNFISLDSVPTQLAKASNNQPSIIITTTYKVTVNPEETIGKINITNCNLYLTQEASEELKAILLKPHRFSAATLEKLSSSQRSQYISVILKANSFIAWPSISTQELTTYANPISNKITSINLQSCKNIIKYDFIKYLSDLNVIIIDNCPIVDITIVDDKNQELTAVKLTNNKLQKLTIKHHKLTELYLCGNELLTELTINSNGLTILDLNNCSSFNLTIEKLNKLECPNLEKLLVKNTTCLANSKHVAKNLSYETVKKIKEQFPKLKELVVNGIYYQSTTSFWGLITKFEKTSNIHNIPNETNKISKHF